MLNKNAIAIAILAVLCICLIVLVALNINKIINNENSLNNETDRAIISSTVDAGMDYQNKLYFVGDSTTYHFFKGGIDKSHLLVPESLTLMLDSTINELTVGTSGLTIAESLKQANAEYVIITIGVNGADHFTEKQYKTYYNKLLDAISQVSPKTKIILQSVFPVTKWYSDQNLGITNVGIDRINTWIKEIAIDRSLPYLDTQSILKNKNGALKDEYENGDGVHMTEEAYEEILKYIRTHAVK